MTINGVNKVGQVDFGAGPIQVEAPSSAEISSQVAAVPEPKPAESKAPEMKSAPVLNADVRLKFIVDQKTNDVTVLVLDKVNRQVIRTIPSDELANLSRGDLVEVFA